MTTLLNALHSFNGQNGYKGAVSSLTLFINMFLPESRAEFYAVREAFAL